ncbi:ABC transporter permease [Cnuibacter physcomitrellae]|nr:ABC transporter permease [Cnuibacter physcomitrellae]
MGAMTETAIDAPTRVLRRSTTRPSGRRVLIAVTICVVALAVAVALGLAIGTRTVDLGSVVRAIVSPDLSDNDQVVIRDIRVPRTLTGLLVGLALGAAGTLMQGITRNPIADPGLFGLNAGAAFAAVIGVVAFGATSSSQFIWFAFAGAAAAAALTYGVSSVGREGATPVKLALAGAAVTVIFTSLTTVLLLNRIVALAQIRSWQVGTLSGRGWDGLVVVAPIVLVAVVVAMFLGRTLNLLAMGDDVATGLGQNVAVARGVSAAVIVVLAASATSLAGPLAFLGLIAPWAARRLVGIDYRWILPLSAVFGAVIVILADVLGRVVVMPAEVEVGVVLAVLGAPLLIAIVRRSKLLAL